MERDDDKHFLASSTPQTQGRAGAGSRQWSDEPPGDASPGDASPRVDVRGLWLPIGDRLIDLIGESGFCALFARTVRMSTVRYDWLSVAPSSASMQTLLAALERDMACTEPAVAATASMELLQTFTGQLSTLIGATLTARLLAEVGVSMPEGRKDVQEHD